MASSRTAGFHHHRGRSADRPSEIPRKGWKDILLRVKSQIKKDHASIVAAGVTFYAFLAIFPAIAASVSLYGLFVDPATVEQQMSQLTALLPAQAHELLSQQLSAVASRSNTALGFGVAVSILLAVWSAKKGANALIEGMNIAYDEEDDRGFFKKTFVTFMFTLGGIIVAILCAALVVALPAALGNLGLPEPMAIAVRVLRWVLLAGILLFSLAVVYRYAPDRDRPKWRWVSWGSGIAVVLWLGASWLFSFYVSNFGSYDKTYGSLAAVVILLMWLFISSYIVLLGAEINSEMEHQTKRDSTSGPEEPLGERGAHHADTVGKPH